MLLCKYKATPLTYLFLYCYCYRSTIPYNTFQIDIVPNRVFCQLRTCNVLRTSLSVLKLVIHSENKVKYIRHNTKKKQLAKESIKLNKRFDSLTLSKHNLYIGLECPFKSYVQFVQLRTSTPLWISSLLICTLIFTIFPYFILR